MKDDEFITTTGSHSKPSFRRSNVPWCTLDAVELLRCKHCEFETVLTLSLRNHINTYHKDKQANIDLRSILQYYQCENCQFQTYSLLVLFAHKCESEKAKIPSASNDYSYQTRRERSLETHIHREHVPARDINWVKCEQLYNSHEKIENLHLDDMNTDVRQKQKNCLNFTKWCNMDGTDLKAIPLCNSDESGRDEEAVESKKKRPENKTWLYVETFPNIEDAEQAVAMENTWSIIATHNTKEGRKRYYRCNKVKRRGVQCAAGVYLLFSADSDEVLMYRVDADHNHELLDSRSEYGLSDSVKAEINRLFDVHLKPKAIMSSLSKMEDIQLPKMSQLRNYLSDRRRIKHGNPVINLGGLEPWLLSHSQVPEDPHEAYVISYEIHDNEPNLKFRFVFSTKHLLKLACAAKVLHVDATHKLTWQGFPVLIVGSTDKNRKFHPLCLGVGTSEQEEDFKMLFNALKNSVSSLKPTVLVSDAAKSIQDAFTAVFGTQVIIRICWARARKKMQEGVEIATTNKDIRKVILEDIDALQSAASPDIFNAASEAFLLKWKHEERFVDYFKNQWLILNRNWYLGAAPQSPATNSALESFIRTIKDSQTIRERLPSCRFLIASAEMVHQWSTRYSYFSKAPTISLEEWTKSYQWAKLTKTISVIRVDDFNTYYRVPSGESSICKIERPWKTFDEYKKQLFSSWEVALPLNKQEWIRGKCSCLAFLKEYICKHIVGLAIRLKYTAPPLEAKTIPISTKRKRGRSSKCGRALIVS